MQLYGYSSADDAIENIGLIEELIADSYSDEYELSFSIQAGLELFQELEAALHDKKIFYLGAQKRTLEESILFYAFSNYFPDFSYDPDSDKLTDLRLCSEFQLCERVWKGFDRCSSLKSGDNSFCSEFEETSRLLSGVSSRASRMCYLLNENFLSWRAFSAAESSLIRGMVSHTLEQLASANSLICSVVNKYEDLLNEYRLLEGVTGANDSLLSDRKNLIIALGTKDYAHDKSSLGRFLLVNSAYCYSLSQYYFEGEIGISGLFAFRSFELLVLSSALQYGVINYIVDKDGVQFRNKDGSAVSGVGTVWSSLKVRLDIDKDVAKLLGFFISVRNKSFLGHGFFHFSKSVVVDAQDGIYKLLKDLLDAEGKGYWLDYKRCSRVQCIRDFLPINNSISL
ncbi:TPA: hypothetical protein L5Q64_000979 [Pseudomonas aeruginosa]|uniref:hypothetical protein n=1 Tax=Pseudomonas aeruginosa TaxID=287 RepID=UPI00114534DD|nr:hypothetical protein [Pseudomonas aeruginosa]NRS71917.1 hypothetical protein [Pseudomonas aeruginosa]HBP0834748.1 hypothetical protein [Pseudomonas aeruginosa]HCT2495805.1 hypothetical protein [Pseudomonas aeruginosa]HCU2035618.1 hypothetical protein [Pseudomonas aeruginosa]HEJ5943256.1 hypothetical protein [Pseudomonas aeruginosa]